MVRACPGVVVRPATDTDVGAITAIYGHYVRHGTSSFETEPPDDAEIARRRLEVLRRGLPYLVAESGGEVAGYAYAAPYRLRAAYRFAIEDSIYVSPVRTGPGLGRVLLTDLIAHCERGCWRQMVAVIGDSGNAASIRLHAACGFEHVGVLRAVGFKFGRWVDTVLMQRPLGGGNRSLPAAAHR